MMTIEKINFIVEINQNSLSEFIYALYFNKKIAKQNKNKPELNISSLKFEIK